MDADTVDGVQGSSFLRSDANDTLSAIITGHASDTEVLRVRSSSYSSNYVYIGGWSSANSNDIARIRSSSNLHIDGPADGNLYLNWYASNRTIHLGNTGQVVKAAGSNTVWHAGNDGSGSGLDADTVDGVQASSFLRSNATDEYRGGTLNINSDSIDGHYVGWGLEYKSSAWRHTNANSWGHAQRNSAGILDIYVAKEAGTADSVATYRVLRVGGSSQLLQYDGNNVWHAGNDGSGSGLDADTVDGVQASSFLRSDANDSTTGTYSFTPGAFATNVTYGGRSIQTALDIRSSSMRGGVLVRNQNDYRSETDSASFMHYDAYNTSATSYAFRAANGTTLADTFWVKGNGHAYFAGDCRIDGELNLMGTSDSNKYLDARVGTAAFHIRKTTGGDTGHETMAYFKGDAEVALYYNNSKKIETTNTGVSINGLLSATTKSFVIDHPTKEGMKLRYGSLEGPENGVYVRGRLKDNNTIELPDYWIGLVHEDTITVNLTPIGSGTGIHSILDIVDNSVVVESTNGNIDCFYTVFGERKDVEKLEVEY